MLKLNFRDYNDFSIWCENNKLQFQYIKNIYNEEIYILTSETNVETLVAISYE